MSSPSSRGMTSFNLARSIEPSNPQSINGSEIGVLRTRWISIGLPANSTWNFETSTTVASSVPPGLLIFTARLILSTDEGRSGYWNMAFSITTFSPNAGIVFSVIVPLAKPSIPNLPAVLTSANSAEYTAGIRDKKVLNSVFFAAKVTSISMSSVGMATHPSQPSTSSLSLNSFSLKVNFIPFKSASISTSMPILASFI